MRARGLTLGQGVYTVSQVCRILRPTMTPRKVQYWLKTGLLSEPIVSGARGYATLLSFQQLLEIRAVQRLRDELGISLPRVRDAFRWILSRMFEGPTALTFSIGADGRLIAHSPSGGIFVVPGGQGVLAIVLPDLNEEFAEVKRAWDARAVPISGYPHLVSNARILAGAPTIRGTRIDTGLLGPFAEDGRFDEATLDELTTVYPAASRDALREALEFEGARPAA